MPITTPLTALLGIEHPVLSAPMDFIAGARLTMAVTSNLSIHFLRRPGPVDLIAEGRALKFGRRLAVLEVTIHSDGDPDAVAHVTGTYALPG